MSSAHEAPAADHESRLYAIRVRGHLDHKWADWFEGLTITRANNGETLLVGPVVDQAALYGFLRKVRDLGLPLLSVVEVEPKRADEPDGRTDRDRHCCKKETSI